MDGDRLQELRKDRGLTQKELADILSLSKYTISSYERGHTNPSKEVMAKMADYFDVSIDYLFGLSKNPDALNHINSLSLRLPDEFDEADRAEVQNYVRYLQFRKGKKK